MDDITPQGYTVIACFVLLVYGLILYGIFKAAVKDALAKKIDNSNELLEKLFEQHQLLLKMEAIKIRKDISKVQLLNLNDNSYKVVTIDEYFEQYVTIDSYRVSGIQ